MSATFMLDDDVAERHRVLVARIDKSARRMNQIVSDLLDFTRTSFGGAIPIEREDMDVTSMVKEVVAEVATRYPASVVKVETSGAPRGQWDCARLTQALTNLVSNAVQHGKEQSSITVAVQGTPEEVAISVRNEGPVVPEADLHGIFTQGGRAGDHARDDEHLGLGLFIVDRIVAAHGGRIDVRSTEVQGTTFTIHLPRAA